MESLRKPGALILEDGRVFEGELMGAPISAQLIKEARLKGETPQDAGFGEVVFNTSMTGYQEILTDPSYYGQVVCMTYPHIGNTGFNLEDEESAHPWCAGLVVHSLKEPSNWRSNGTLEDYLIKHQIPGLTGIDTRALTRHLRSQGVTRAIVLPLEEKEQGVALLKELPSFEGRDLIKEVSTPESYSWPLKGQVENPRYKVAALDYGVKWNLLRHLEQRGCEVRVFPADTPADVILRFEPNGVFLSNGPGDPSAAPYAERTVKDLLGKLPIFGVCMGHHMLCRALGAQTYKLKFGHRGGNQPVLDHSKERVEISSHNHGYSVDPSTLPDVARVSHTNLNDKTVEGVEVPSLKAFSVQYHPEASPGPHDSEALFDRFIELF